MVRSGIKRSIHDIGYAATIASLSEEEKRVWAGKAQRLADALAELNPFSASEGSADDKLEPESMFPGAPLPVIPITSGKVEIYNYGFLPEWAKDLKEGLQQYNARTDSLRVKPTWKKSWYGGQRCLVMATGYYETDRKTKTRYRFFVKNQPQIFYAGIYNHWHDRQNNRVLKTFAVITTEPNALVEPIHNRMPVILDKQAQKRWLDSTTPEADAFNLLKPFPAELMDLQEAPPPPRKKKVEPQLGLGF